MITPPSHHLIGCVYTLEINRETGDSGLDSERTASGWKDNGLRERPFEMADNKVIDSWSEGTRVLNGGAYYDVLSTVSDYGW